MTIGSPSSTIAIGPPTAASGRHVADDEAVTAAREPAVGDQRDLAAEAAADDGARRAQHLGHAGCALRALVANHDHVAGRRRRRR